MYKSVLVCVGTCFWLVPGSMDVYYNFDKLRTLLEYRRAADQEPNYNQTYSPLCRACMRADETAAHVLLECDGVASYRAKYLGTPRSLPEAFGDIRKLLGFLEELVFSSLENYQMSATPVSEQRYPWIARVSHSRSARMPHVCTAVCLDTRIFATAARCINSLKVDYTTVTYMSRMLRAVAFVTPSNGTKQAFDDIGIIVVEGATGIDSWMKVQPYSGANRTDKQFRWFADYVRDHGSAEHVVVGYATAKGIHRIKAADREYNLTELSVTIGVDMCSTIFTFNHLITGFFVPCYHSCTLEQFQRRDGACERYHGVEGGAVVNTITDQLIGLATWGAYFPKYNLPVGFSVPNSDNFHKDLSCAQRVRDNRGVGVSYQSICE